jgi:hypothetical protein
VETKEQLGGYYLIEAKDREEAIQVAARIPGAWIGCVEVRPIAEDDETRLYGLGETPNSLPRRGRDACEVTCPTASLRSPP